MQHLLPAVTADLQKLFSKGRNMQVFGFQSGVKSSWHKSFLNDFRCYYIKEGMSHAEKVLCCYVSKYHAGITLCLFFFSPVLSRLSNSVRLGVYTYSIYTMFFLKVINPCSSYAGTDIPYLFPTSTYISSALPNLTWKSNYEIYLLFQLLSGQVCISYLISFLYQADEYSINNTQNCYWRCICSLAYKLGFSTF